MLFEHVISGLDLSPRTHRVAAFAATFAKSLGAEVTFVHADPEEAARLKSLPAWAAIEAATAAVRERAVATVEAAAGSSPNLVHRIGSPESVLQTEAELRGGRAVVVIGSGATGNVPDVGVTTTRCLRTVTLPVLVVPTHRTTEPSVVKQVLAPIDFEAGTVEGLQLADALARELGATLTVAHVVRPPMLGGLLGAQEHEADLPGAVAELVVRADARLVHEVRAVGIHHATTRVVEAVRAADGISALADEIGADLIVLPAHGHGAVARFFLGSTSERLVRLTNTPVLVLPPTWLTIPR